MKLLLLVVCCVALATAVLAAPSDVKAQAADYDHAEVKHLCLKESKQYNCRYVGCPGVAFCNGTAEADPVCGSCVTHLVGQSDVTCCDHPDYGYDEDNGPGDLFSQALKVGTCDWDVDIYDTSIELENGAFKVGTAWGTCYMNADAEHCGHPFCDRMVMSFQGGIYVMNAYSRTPGDGLASGATTDASGTVDFDDGSTSPWGCFWGSLLSLPEERTAGNSRAARAGTKASALRSAIRSSGLLKKAANQRKNSARFANIESTDYYGHHKSNRTYYAGVAIMITGPVTVTSMNKHLEYSSGMLEYTPFFYSNSVPLDGTQPAAKGTVVKPGQYDILLVADKSSGGDYYKQEGDSYKPEYKEYKPEYKPEYKDYKPEYKEEKYYKPEGERRHYREGADREGYYPHEAPRYRR